MSPAIWAIGDVIVGPMLAHKAEEEGSCVAEMLAGQKPHIDYDIIPGVVYTAPEVASIGKTEEQLKEAGTAYKVGKFPFMANSRARSVGAHGRLRQDPGRRRHRPGAGRPHHRPRGRHPDRRDRRSPWSSAPRSEDIARTCHAHPTLEEAVKEAALATFAKPIHM